MQITNCLLLLLNQSGAESSQLVSSLSIASNLRQTVYSIFSYSMVNLLSCLDESMGNIQDGHCPNLKYLCCLKYVSRNKYFDVF